MRLDEKYKKMLTDNGLNQPIIIAHFFSQLEHESGLKPIQENLNYSADGLFKTFPKYFPTKGFAMQYERQPQKIANRVYANRMGNGDEASNDGFKYRGRGFIQLTGKDNYKRLSDAYKVDFVQYPDLLLQEEYALLSAIWFWGTNGLNKFARLDDIVSITKRINGGTIGLEHRKECLVKWKKLLGCN
jgi:putative chitinase